MTASGAVPTSVPVGDGGAAGELDQEVDGALGGDAGNVPVHAAFEALGGLGRQLVAAAGAGDRDFLEVRRLDQDRRRRVADLGGGAAHHAGNADRAGGVGDEEVFGVERAFLAVQGAQLLAGNGAPDDDVAGEPVLVIEVQRLAELEHDVVGDVHRQGDGADAGEAEPRGHPRRAWASWR